MLKVAIACALLFVAVSATPYRDCGNSFEIIVLFFTPRIIVERKVLHFKLIWLSSHDSGSTAALTAVRVPGCNALPCIVYRGTNVTVEYDFTAGVFKIVDNIFIY
jgi:Niemann-Pick C2 protein